MILQPTLTCSRRTCLTPRVERVKYAVQASRLLPPTPPPTNIATNCCIQTIATSKLWLDPSPYPIAVELKYVFTKSQILRYKNH
jgi:hypothetical protein